MQNSFGKLFTITSFGESHGSCMGVVVDGCPAGLSISAEDIQKQVDKRKSTGIAATGRVEEDKVEILSGTADGFTTGAPVCMLTWNRNIDSKTKSAFWHIPEV